MSDRSKVLGAVLRRAMACGRDGLGAHCMCGLFSLLLCFQRNAVYNTEKCCRVAWARTLLRPPSWQIASISVLLWGACFSQRSAEPVASALGGLNTLAFFLLGLCSACLLLVDFIHCGIFPRPTKYAVEGPREYMQQQI